MDITLFIRNDDLENLQEKASQTNFNYNQKTDPPIYEKCSLIYQENVTLIDYAAFFGSLKCFKYLLMNGANVNNSLKYAVAGGNIEIIHLCEQNHSPCKDVLEIAIEYHRNDIFHYFYDKKHINQNVKTSLGIKCIKYCNYELFTFLENEGLKISNEIIYEFLRIGNIFVVKDVNYKYCDSYKILLALSESGNSSECFEIISKLGKYFDVNEKNIFLVNLIFYIISWRLFKLFLTLLMTACLNRNIKIVKILLDQKETDINVPNVLFVISMFLTIVLCILK